MSDMFERALSALKELVAVDSVQSAPCKASPFGEGVAKCFELVAADARRNGFTVGEGDGYYVWAEVGKGRLFGILGHLDTVPLGGGWHADPLGEIKDGVFYGRKTKTPHPLHLGRQRGIGLEVHRALSSARGDPQRGRFARRGLPRDKLRKGRRPCEACL